MADQNGYLEWSYCADNRVAPGTNFTLVVPAQDNIIHVVTLIAIDLIITGAASNCFWELNDGTVAGPMMFEGGLAGDAGNAADHLLRPGLNRPNTPGNALTLQMFVGAGVVTYVNLTGYDR
jgi:hypothetical protein